MSTKKRDARVIVRGPFTGRLHLLIVRFVPGDRSYASRVVAAITLAVLLGACGSVEPHDLEQHEHEPADLTPLDVTGMTMAYTKLWGTCSDRDFELEAFAVPVWLTVWPCELEEHGTGLVRLECWKPIDAYEPRLVVVHSFHRDGDGILGHASFFGPECEGDYSTRFGAARGGK
ncbi:hypothetical protein Rctr16k_10 [Virus Rctr16k]|nr:hypothetical protein Rctr16k_10 [Virus Rctr16k]